MIIHNANFAVIISTYPYHHALNGFRRSPPGGMGVKPPTRCYRPTAQARASAKKFLGPFRPLRPLHRYFIPTDRPTDRPRGASCDPTELEYRPYPAST